MKNRAKLRTMTIGEKAYFWSYNYDDMDFSNYPCSYYLFSPAKNPKLTIRVRFSKYAPPMKIDSPQEGTPCLYHGQPEVMNLCRPHFAKQVLEYVFQNGCSETDTGVIDIPDGERILTELGYSDFFEEAYHEN